MQQIAEGTVYVLRSKIMCRLLGLLSFSPHTEHTSPYMLTYPYSDLLEIANACLHEVCIIGLALSW
jgi:hypothetical protein